MIVDRSTKEPLENSGEGPQELDPLATFADLTSHLERSQELAEEYSLSSIPMNLKVDGRVYEFLGLGAQAAVYEHEGQVLKVGHNIHQAFEVLEHLAPGAENNLATAVESHHTWNRLTEEFRQQLASGQVDPALIANTSIDAAGMVWQDKVTPVEKRYDPKRIGEYPVAEVKALIDTFAESFVASWKSGFAELECSLFTNYGFDRTGRLTMHDFGNSSFEFKEALASVSGRVTAEEVEAFLSGEAVQQN
ncbi:MAG: hypothetical protein KDD62_08205, partial [Bdellovibrionales bacterium]|nr:hypothetical protein [Bdellovibrionales bacterium]